MQQACLTGEEHLRIAVSISVTQDPHKVGNGCEFGMKMHALVWQKGICMSLREDVGISLAVAQKW